jgi:uncharacterized protein (TIRG00374 family)
MRTPHINQIQRSKTIKWLVWILKLLIATGILYYIFTIIPFSAVVEAITSVKSHLIAFAFPLLISERYAAAIRQKILTEKVAISLSINKIFEINIVSIFYGWFLPGDLGGGVVRWYKMSQPEGKRAEALAFITFDRLIDTIVLLLLGMLFLSVDLQRISNRTIALSFFAVLGGFVMMLLLCLSRKFAIVLLKPLERYQSSKILALTHEKLSKLLNSVLEYRQFSPKLIMVILSLTLARHLLAIAIFYIFALCLEMNVTFASIGWIRSFLNIAMLIPITFSGLGVREGSLILLLRPYGVPGTEAVALSFLILMMSIFIAAMGGLFEVKNMLTIGGQKEKTTQV